MKFWITLSPHDTLFFRSSRSFGAIDSISAFAESSLLPNPSVIFGLIRRHLWEDQRGVGDWDRYYNSWRGWKEGQNLPQDSLTRLLGPYEMTTDWPKESLRLVGFLPVEQRTGSVAVDSLFPLPSFVLLSKGANIAPKNMVLSLPRHVSGKFGGVILGNSVNCNSLNPVLPKDLEESIESVYAFLRKMAFVNLLKGEIPEAAFVEKDLVLPQTMARVETKTGIARDNVLRKNKQGHVYMFDHYRWNGNNFPVQYGLRTLMEADIPNPVSSVLSRLGCKGHMAFYSYTSSQEGWLSDTEKQEIIAKILQTRRWFLTLATPAIFENGWHPKWLRGDADTGWKLHGGDGNVLSDLTGACLEKPTRQSGWDLATGNPKPVRSMIPIGSTWFFEIPGNAAEVDLVAFLNSVQANCISDIYCHAGYGLSFIGAWHSSI